MRMIIIGMITSLLHMATAHAATETQWCLNAPQQITDAAAVKGSNKDVERALRLRDTAILLCANDNKFEARAKFMQAMKLLGMEFYATK